MKFVAIAKSGECFWPLMYFQVLFVVIFEHSKIAYTFSSSASLFLGIRQSKHHELHALPIKFTVTIDGVIKIVATWSDSPIPPLFIFLVSFFLLITLNPSSSIHSFPCACSHDRGTESSQISWLQLHPPSASTHIFCLDPTLIQMLHLKCLFAFLEFQILYL